MYKFELKLHYLLLSGRAAQAKPEGKAPRGLLCLEHGEKSNALVGEQNCILLIYKSIRMRKNPPHLLNLKNVKRIEKTKPPTYSLDQVPRKKIF